MEEDTMNNKHLGAILIIIGLAMTLITTLAKEKEDFYIEELIKAHEGVCVLENDYCLHQDRDLTPYIIGWVIGLSTAILGIYLIFFEKSFEAFARQQQAFAKEMTEAKKKDEFAAYLAGFSPEEQNVLKAVREQDGIMQSTLRYRTGTSKATLSLILDSLEKRDVISRKVAGKTKEVYLRKKF